MTSIALRYWFRCRDFGSTSDAATLPLFYRLVVEPEVFEPRAIVDAIDHQGQPFYPRLPARGLTGIEDDRANTVLGQLPFDLPDQLPALLAVGLHRLSVDQLVELRITIAAIIPLGAAHVALIELLIGIVEAVLADHHADSEILARDLGIPLRGVDGFELTVDVDLFQLVDQDHRGIPGGGNVADRDLDRDALVGAVAEPCHYLARFGAVLCDVRVIAGQRSQHF